MNILLVISFNWDETREICRSKRNWVFNSTNNCSTIAHSIVMLSMSEIYKTSWPIGGAQFVVPHWAQLVPWKHWEQQRNTPYNWYAKSWAKHRITDWNVVFNALEVKSAHSELYANALYCVPSMAAQQRFKLCVRCYYKKKIPLGHPKSWKTKVAPFVFAFVGWFTNEKKKNELLCDNALTQPNEWCGEAEWMMSLSMLYCDNGMWVKRNRDSSHHSNGNRWWILRHTDNIWYDQLGFSFRLHEWIVTLQNVAKVPWTSFYTFWSEKFFFYAVACFGFRWLRCAVFFFLLFYRFVKGSWHRCFLVWIWL